MLAIVLTVDLGSTVDQQILHSRGGWKKRNPASFKLRGFASGDRAR